MENPAASTEQQQLDVEIKAVTTNIGKYDDVSKASYEIEQGRKLIEKARSVGLPEQAYSDLQRSIANFDSAKPKS